MELWAVSLVSYVVPFVLHSFGMILLLTKSSNVSRSQTILMINLSLSEICLSATSAAYIVVYYYYGNQNIMYQHAVICSMAFCLPYYAVMYILTLDRLAEVYLNIRYPLYWSARKTKYCMIIVWLITLCLQFSLFVYIRVEQVNGFEKLEDFSHFYGFPFVDMVFVIIAFATYIYIMRKIRRNRKVMARMSVSIERNTDRNTDGFSSNGQKLRQHPKPANLHLLLPFLLVTTFVLFIVIPDFIFLLMYKGFLANTFLLDIIMNIILSIGYSSDACIYVLLSTLFKNLLRSWFRRWFKM
ncbi:histamine H2 receptor-like [Hydractinia symbiolongicarpus]|uniref:histamine H2 receptor-like n=1 Tax=Hydractinia symbiolongicarpus TaxID=13093 RepID=UPI00255029CA|nr:histamine H2 receptor-like [Hydractinia symbiolongicarpus]